MLQGKIAPSPTGDSPQIHRAHPERHGDLHGDVGGGNSTNSIGDVVFFGLAVRGK
jgi:hypothetical protein